MTLWTVKTWRREDCFRSVRGAAVLTSTITPPWLNSYFKDLNAKTRFKMKMYFYRLQPRRSPSGFTLFFAPWFSIYRQIVILYCIKPSASGASPRPSRTALLEDFFPPSFLKLAYSCLLRIYLDCLCFVCFNSCLNILSVACIKAVC